MDTKKIKAMLMVVKTGSLTAAAEELGYTQPGLTNMMKSLENELGVVILNRSKSGIKLSDTGLMILQDAENLLAASDEFERKIERLRKSKAVSLKVGACSSVARLWLPEAIKKYKAANPNAEISVSVQDTASVYEAVKVGELDCAVVGYSESLLDELTWIELASDELQAIFPPEYNPDVRVLSEENFAHFDFLMPSMELKDDVNAVLDAMESAKPEMLHTNLEDSAIISMVSHGLGASIMSEMVMQDNAVEVSVIPLNPPTHRILGIIMNAKAQQERGVNSFVEYAEEVVKAMQTEGEIYINEEKSEKAL